MKEFIFESEEDARNVFNNCINSQNLLGFGDQDINDIYHDAFVEGAKNYGYIKKPELEIDDYIYLFKKEIERLKK